MKVLVTGATGRVGSRLIPRLLVHGSEVRVLVRTKEKAESFRGSDLEAITGDLLQPETLVRAVARTDAVVHLAAFFRGASEAEARAVNYEGTLALASAARQASLTKFIYISTNMVYGPGRGRPAREDDEPFPSPEHFYPVTKLAAEQGLRDLFQDQEDRLCTLRLAFVYGDGDPHLEEALNMTRAWPPAKRKHMVHHADVAQGILLCLDHPESGGKIYNLADDSPVPISQVRRMFGADAAEFPAGPEVDDPWEGIVDTSRIKAEMGFRPIYPSLRVAQESNAL